MKKTKRLTVLYILLLIAFSFLLMTFLNKSYDYFWHIKAGQYMFKNNIILTHDVFSWIVQGKYWISHEWLFEVIIYGLKIVFGNIHGLIYVFINILLLSVILFYTNKKEYLKNIPFSLLWISLMMIFIGFIQVRPHLISYNLIALTIYLLYDLYKNKDSNKIYLLPILSIIWSNVHGGSSNLVYILTIIFLVSGLFKFSYKKIESTRLNKKQIQKYITVIILCLVGICINPHGLKMLIYPYQNIMNNTMLNSIAEWQPTNFSNLSHIPYLLLIVIVIFTYLFSNKKIRLIDFLLIGFSIVLGLKSIRFWPYIYIISTYNIFYYINKRKLDKGTDYILILLIIIILLLGIFNLKHLNKTNHIKVIDNKAINYLKSKKPKRLYNYYDYGGYLVYKDIKVFIDGRADLYSEYNYKDYLDISRLNNNYNNLIKKYNFDYYIIPKKIKLNKYLSNSNKYKVEYKDNKIIIYKNIEKD
ncbi:MAG: hypothetical protein IKG58_02610 [Bacilli bacterium]|nr:hypothetical protein [Bacilli bacterium]